MTENNELRLVMYILVNASVSCTGPLLFILYANDLPDTVIVIRVMTLWYVYLLTILNYLVYYSSHYYPPLEIALNCKRV